MDKEINIWLNNNPYQDKKRAKSHSDAILQQLLQIALGSSQQVPIFKGQNGKPFTDAPIYFSHSNSAQLHAYVISHEEDIGLDVEIKKLDRKVLKTAQRYFHETEYQALLKLEKPVQFEHFYKQWTKKEAWCKLEGGNLWRYLNQSTESNDHINFKHCNQVKGFAVALASKKPIGNIRINNIGNP